MATAQKQYQIKVLIMAGGRGTRMWPISSMAHPKQFESILGKKSMFRETVERVLGGFKAEDIYIATSKEYKEHIMRQAQEVPEANFMFEPAMRDNLGALGLATALIHKRHADAVMIVLWGADHVVQKGEVFRRALKYAADLAHENKVIVHVDTVPSYPSVHNGWIERGDQVRTNGKFPGYEFVRQVEKPDLYRAKEFYASDTYFIHTGYMATVPSLFLEYYATYAPETYAIIEKIIAAEGTPAFEETL